MSGCALLPACVVVRARNGRVRAHADREAEALEREQRHLVAWLPFLGDADGTIRCVGVADGVAEGACDGGEHAREVAQWNVRVGAVVSHGSSLYA